MTRKRKQRNQHKVYRNNFGAIGRYIVPPATKERMARDVDTLWAKLLDIAQSYEEETGHYLPRREALAMGLGLDFELVKLARVDTAFTGSIQCDACGYDIGTVAGEPFYCLCRCERDFVLGKLRGSYSELLGTYGLTEQLTAKMREIQRARFILVFGQDLLPESNEVRVQTAKDAYRAKDGERRASVKTSYRFDSKVLGSILPAKPSIDYHREVSRYGENERLFGIELEVEGGYREFTSGVSDNLLAFKKHQESLGLPNYACVDGSLRAGGVEIVTAPRTYDEIMAQAGLIRATLKNMAQSGLRSHDTTTCGLHVHVSRASLSEQAITRITRHVSKNATAWRTISRRSPESWNQWSGTGNTNRGGRYRAVNLLPTNTIEFRMFRGTLKPESFFAAIEAVHALCEFCSTDRRSYSLRELARFVVSKRKGKERPYIYFAYQLQKLFPELLATAKPRRKMTPEERAQAEALRTARAEQREIVRRERFQREQSDRTILLRRVSDYASHRRGDIVLPANIDASHYAGQEIVLRATPVTLRGETQEHSRLLRNVSPIAFLPTVAGVRTSIESRYRRGGWGRSGRWVSCARASIA